MNPALETLMLAFATAEGLAAPARALFLGAQAHHALLDWPQVTGWQPLKPHADVWDAAGLFRTDELQAGTWPVVLVLPNKSRDEALSWFALARDRLALGGRIVCAMPNSAGAGRFEQEFAKAVGRVTSLQKNKCRAFHAVDDGSWDERVIDAWRALGNWREIPGSRFMTRAGVFSCDHIDPGSHLLAMHLPANLRGITYHWHDVTTGLPGTYDAIIMNPPFHTGQTSDVDLGRAFLLTAAAALRRGGKLLLVANRQLPYEAVLDAAGLTWRITAEDPTYKLLFANKR
ncbi:MAG: methyltransferase [Verrucomicrobia bacterium]|nr:methyltransferase [Verrucomicrobiota bacterium]